jgi:CRISPR-associated protein Cmr5
MKTLEQELADKVYKQVADYAEVNKKDSPERKKYGSMAHKLPILVRTAGLAQALAFVESRGKKPHHELLEHLAQAVSQSGRDAFVNQSRTAAMQEYVYLTRKTMLALKWYKRFAESVLDVKATDEGEDGGRK